MYVIKHTIAVTVALAVLIALNVLLAAYYGPGPWLQAAALVLASGAALLMLASSRSVAQSIKDAERCIDCIADGEAPSRLKTKQKGFDGVKARLNRLYKVSQEALARQNDIITAIPVAVIRLDASGSVTYMNDSAFMLTGRNTSGSLDLDYTDPTPNASHHEIKEVFKTALDGTPVTGREITILDKDFRELLCECSAVPSWKGAGADGCVLILRDVDEKKRLETELKSAWMKAEEATAKLNKTVEHLEEFSVMAVRRELKIQEIREKLTELKKDTGLKRSSFDKTA